MTADNPFSFLHVDKAEIDLPKDIDIYSPEVYKKAKENLYGMIEKGILVQDDKPMLYISRTYDERKKPNGNCRLRFNRRVFKRNNKET